jgi:hypothetical protein
MWVRRKNQVKKFAAEQNKILGKTAQKTVTKPHTNTCKII